MPAAAPGESLLAVPDAALGFGKHDYVDPVSGGRHRGWALARTGVHGCRSRSPLPQLCLLSLVRTPSPVSLLQRRLEALVDDMAKADEKRGQWHRRRAVVEGEGGVDYINDANRRFNAKIDTKLGKYSVDYKQALERGTAL